MGFYFRKSISAGPFRFNLSGSGLGLSVGMKGFRVGTGPRGNYVHMGRGGLYYRASLGGRTHQHTDPSRPRFPRSPDSNSPAPVLAPVESGNVLEMVPTGGSDIVEQINRKLAALRSWPWALGMGLALTFLASTLPEFSWLAWPLLLLTVVACVFFSSLDAQRRTVVIMYDLDEESISRFKHFVEEFDALTSRRIWNIDASGAIADWKRNAGAGQLVRRQPARLTHGTPKVIKTNVDIPAIHGGRRSIHFFPDVALVLEGNTAGAIRYDQLDLEWQTTTFIEEDGVPSDSAVIGYTWKFVNKKGGPDRRFRNNRQLPKVAYLEMSIGGPGGLHKVLQFSRVLDHTGFDSALNELANFIKTLSDRSTIDATTIINAPKLSRSTRSAPFPLNDEAKRLETGRPDFWEYKLTVELLRIWVSPLIRKWKDLKQELTEKHRQTVREDEILGWCQDKLGKVSNFAQALSRLLNQELPASWGPQGKPGDADSINAVCRQIAELAQSIISWEESVRFATVPQAFEEVRSLLAGSAGLVLDQIAKVYEDLRQVFEQEHPSGRYSIALTLELPKGWHEKFHSALGRATRSLNS
jgi:hypothetical protein